MAFLSQDSRVGVSKSRQLGLLQLWNPITLRENLWLRCSLKQSYSSRQELSNDMWHAPCSKVNWVDSRLFVVGSQTGSLTPGPSFGHNVHFRCLNEQCEPTLDIYVLRNFQWYKKRHKTLSFDPSNCSLKFWKSTGTPSPKVGVALGVWGFIPSYSLTLSNTPGSMWCDSRASSCLDSRASSCFNSRTSSYLNSRTSSCLNSRTSSCLNSQTSSWPATLQPLCLGREPKARVTIDQAVHVVVEPLCRLVVSIGRGDCPSMNSVWTAVVCDLADLT
jgi:hypothetical protein